MVDDLYVHLIPSGCTISVFHKDPFLKFLTFLLRFIFIVERVNWSPRLKLYENSVH